MNAENTPELGKMLRLLLLTILGIVAVSYATYHVVYFVAGIAAYVIGPHTLLAFVGMAALYCFVWRPLDHNCRTTRGQR